RLDDDVDHRDFYEQWRIALFVPVRIARQTQRGELMLPQRMTVALALNEQDITGCAWVGEAVQAVEARLRPVAPHEALFAFKRDSEAHRHLGAGRIEIGNPQHRSAAELEFAKPHRAQKLDRNLLRLGVNRERA